MGYVSTECLSVGSSGWHWQCRCYHCSEKVCCASLPHTDFLALAHTPRLLCRFPNFIFLSYIPVSLILFFTFPYSFTFLLLCILFRTLSPNLTLFSSRPDSYFLLVTSIFFPHPFLTKLCIKYCLFAVISFTHFLSPLRPLV